MTLFTKSNCAQVQRSGGSLRICAGLLVLAATTLAGAQTAGDVRAAHEFRSRVIRAADAYKAGDTDRSLRDFDRLYRENPRDPDVEGWLGFLLLVKNRGQEAVPMLEDARRQKPDDLEVADNLGNAYYAAGEYDRALSEYQGVVRADGSLFVPHYNSGNIYLKRGDYVHALVEYRRAAALKQNDAAVQNDLGVCYERLRDDRNAANAFMRASDLERGNRIYGRNAALALMRCGRANESSVYLERADSTDPEIGLAMGDYYSHAGRADRALSAYEGIKDHMSSDSAFWFNLGVMRADAGDSRGAEEAYRHSLSINPNDLDALTNLGLILFHRGDYRDAEVLFDKLSGLNPGSVSAKMDLGSAAAKAGDPQKAIAAWSSVLRSEPGDTKVRLALADLQYIVGDLAGADANYRRVIHAEPNNARALNGIGLLYLKNSQLVPAEAAFRSSIQSDPRYVPAYTNLGITFERENRRGAAISVLEKASSIDPQDPAVRKTLHRIRQEN